MIEFTEITDFNAPELDVYARLTEAPLLNRFEPKKGMFIAESPKVICRALDAGCRPVSLLVDTQGTGTLPDEKLAQLVSRCFDLRPAGIISMLDLRRPIYRQTAAFGHFGRTDIDLPWEHTDRVEQLRAEAAKL